MCAFFLKLLGCYFRILKGNAKRTKALSSEQRDSIFEDQKKLQDLLILHSAFSDRRNKQWAEMSRFEMNLKRFYQIGRLLNEPTAIDVGNFWNTEVKDTVIDQELLKVCVSLRNDFGWDAFRKEGILLEQASATRILPDVLPHILEIMSGSGKHVQPEEICEISNLKLPSEKPIRIRVDCVAARSLPNFVGSEDDVSDPYCIAKIEIPKSDEILKPRGSQLPKLRSLRTQPDVLRTHTVKNDLNPIWACGCSLRRMSSSRVFTITSFTRTKIRFEVFDGETSAGETLKKNFTTKVLRKNVKSTSLGYMMLSLDDWRPSLKNCARTHRAGWFPLLDANGTPNNAMIHIKMELQ